MSSLPHADVVSMPPLPPRRGAARASTWWGKAWVRAVEEAAYAEADLRAARALARGAAVGGISIDRGRMVAAVSDGSGLYTVDIRMPMLDESSSAALVEAVAAEAGRIGALLGGDLPHALVEHAEDAGVELLPFGGELEATCTCEAWLDPCAHALALLYQVAWLVDADAVILFHLRGLPRDTLLARLHARETSAASHDDSSAAAGQSTGAEALLLDTALDAAVRAQRLLELLDTDASIEHLF